MRGILVLVILALASPARADGLYFTESLGGTDVKDQLGDYMSSAFHFRVGVGMRTGRFAIEAHAGAHLDASQEPVAGEGYALATYGLDLKYVQPVIANRLEIYLRGGLRYALLEDESGYLANYAGRGLAGGAGIQLKGKVRALGFLAWPFFFLKIGPKITGALWLDADGSFYRLHPNGRQDATPSIDAKLTTISGGFAVGSDF